MHPEPALDQHTEPRLGAQFDAIASAIVDIESLLAIVPGLDLSGDHPSATHVLMGRVDIVPQEAYPSSVYADGSKVHAIGFHGRYYKSRGPLNTVRPPQGRPVFTQAGGSPRGREFAAKYADSIIATATGIEGMKAYRDDVRARMEAHGRKPDDCKVLFLVSPILGDTEEEAHRKRQAMISAPDYIEETLIGMASITEIDFFAFDLDAPLPPITTNGERGSLDKFAQWGSGKTLRELASERVDRSIELVGTPDQVVARMGEVMDEIGGDGFLITRPGMTGLTRKYIIEISDGLIPALQRRGLARTDYTYAHFRDNLLEF
jgi:long-chain alkane monooxygenase